MHTVLVNYVLPGPVPREKMMEGFKQVEGRFRATPKLIRKYFSYDESEHTGHSVYLWGKRSRYSGVFQQRVRDRLQGEVPELFYVDTLMVIDNEAGKTATS